MVKTRCSKRLQLVMMIEKSVKLWTVEKIEVEKYIPRKLEKQPAPFE